MTPAKIIKAHLWVDPKVGVPHDDRLVICFNEKRDPHKFIGCYSHCWRREQEIWPMDVDRWRDLPDDPVLFDDNKPIQTDVTRHLGFQLSAFGVHLVIDSWFSHLDWGYVRKSQMQHNCWEVCLHDGVLSLSEIIKVTEFIWQQKHVGIFIIWVIK